MKTEHILEDIGTQALDCFLALAGLPKDAKVEALASVRYYRGSKEDRKFMRSAQKLEQQWYASLPDMPDYSVYMGKEILTDIWACWVAYSREYLRCMQNPRGILSCDMTHRYSIIEELGSPEIIADLGCGIGYTSAALSQLFPQSKVYATNLVGSAQFKVCQKMAGTHKFSLAGSVEELPNISCVFASEYFGHFESPVEHLKEVLAKTPKHLIIANAFSSKSLGHFDRYKIDGKWVEGKKVGRVFNQYLRQSGYEKIPTICWNDRPTVWVKTPRYES
jgi:hypothetical protein